MLRSHPVYRSVFIKTAKSHTEQILDANFNVVLNEMKNGRSYYISDNGRIRQKASDNRDGGRTGVHTCITHLAMHTAELDLINTATSIGTICTITELTDITIH